EVGVVGGSREAREAGVMLLLRQTTPGERTLVDLLDIGATAGNGLVVALDHVDGQARVTHGGCNACTHGATADNADLRETPGLNALDFGRTGSSALGEKDMAQSRRLRRDAQAQERLTLEGKRIGKGRGDGVSD